MWSFSLKKAKNYAVRAHLRTAPINVA